MRSNHLIASVLALSAAAVAQNNEFWNYASSNNGEATTWTSRHGVSTAGTGYVYKGFTGFSAIGNPASVVTSQTEGEFIGFTGIIQDSVGVTPHNYEMFVSVADATTSVPPSDALDSVNAFAAPNAAVLASSGPLGTTTTPPSTATGAVAWRVTFTAANSISGINADEPVWVGVWFGPSASGDSLTVHGASYASGTTGENPNSNAPENTWIETISGTTASGVAETPSASRNARLGLLTQSMVLEVGADIDPAFDRNGGTEAFDYGIAGRFPQQQLRGDGMSFRVIDANNDGQVVAVLLSLAPLANPAPAIAGIPGYLSISPIGLLGVPVASGTITAGEFESGGPFTIFAYPNPFPLPQNAQIGFQAVVLDFAQSRIQLSNGVQAEER